jgi:hypothetical protein
MIKRWVLSALLSVGLVVPLACGASGPGDEIFSDIDGWTRDGEPLTYSPDDLFEYINGAADVYLGYEFQELASLSYDRGESQSLTIDVYRHDSNRNAFGIYSQERPLEARFVNIGSQGYYEEGVLNFWKGHYYVKIVGFDLRDDDEPLLTGVARDIAGRLEGETGFPKPVQCLPEKGMIANREKYIARDFLGHGFLCCAFVADYKLDGGKTRLFIIEAGDEGGARGMLERYMALVEKKGNEIALQDGVYRFQDPYQSSSGPLHLTQRGRYLWGLFTGDPSVAAFYLEQVEDALERYGLID